MKNNLNNIFSESECLSEEMLYKYLEDKLTAKEKYIVENHLQSCEFCSDALEGLSLLKNVEEAKSMIGEIKNEIINKSFTKKNKIIWFDYRVKLAVAASIILLIGISFLLRYYFKRESENKIALNSSPKSEAIYKELIKTDTSKIGIQKEKIIQKDFEEGKGIISEKLKNIETGKSQVYGDGYLIVDDTRANRKALTDEQNRNENVIIPKAENKEIALLESAEKKQDTVTTAINQENVIIKDEVSNNVTLAENVITQKNYAGLEKSAETKEKEKTESKVESEDKKGALNQTSPAMTGQTDFGKTDNDVLNDALLKFNSKDFVAAIPLLEQILSHNPDNYKSLYYAGVSYFNLNNAAKAIIYFDKVLKNKKGEFYNDAQWYKALALIKNENINEAKKLLIKIYNEGGSYKSQADEKLKEMK